MSSLESLADASGWDDAALDGPVFASYVYSYPHKTAYRTLDPQPTLRDVWKDEPRDSLFLYLHVPFCEYRCGFCNLFTRATPPEELTRQYLAQLRCEAQRVRDQLGDVSFARLAIGGGTPTYLTEEELPELLSIARDIGVDASAVPAGIECSPATASTVKLRILKEFGIDRVSIGIQSFDDQESSSLGRPQKRAEAVEALDRIADVNFSTLNLDLIYGAAGQTPDDFVRSVETALQWSPEEIYLYPLYVRPLTGLGRRGESWDDHRLACVRAARDRLLGAGYEQVSLRMFRAPHAPVTVDPPYACQTDGMVGLGCGARSYTDRLHYSTEYAVGRSGVHEILNDYIQRDPDDFHRARHGFVLDDEDRQRRFVIMSLLQADGLSLPDFKTRFHLSLLEQFPELQSLVQRDLATVDESVFKLTPAGIELSDAIGPWLFSHKVTRLMEAHECR